VTLDIDALRARLRSILYAERVTRILCRRSGLVEGFEPFRKGGHRVPPLPFHAKIHKGPGWCRVCGQPIYGGGSFRRHAGAQSKRLTWHSICTTTYFIMTKPADYAAVIILKQGCVCALSGAKIALPYSTNVEVDHSTPLYRVARDHASEPWHELLRFWMTGNLQVITKAAHLHKCAEEAGERAGRPLRKPEQLALL
jgi:hypothetical protein